SWSALIPSSSCRVRSTRVPSLPKRRFDRSVNSVCSAPAIFSGSPDAFTEPTVFSERGKNAWPATSGRGAGAGATPARKVELGVEAGAEAAGAEAGTGAPEGALGARAGAALGIWALRISGVAICVTYIDELTEIVKLVISCAARYKDRRTWRTTAGEVTKASCCWRRRSGAS